MGAVAKLHLFLKVPFPARVSKKSWVVGKYFAGHLQLGALSMAKQGRWVYEGSELKAFRIPTKYFSINFIVLTWGFGCEYSVAPWWAGASYSVWVH